jgi:hypothetical protein
MQLDQRKSKESEDMDFKRPKSETRIVLLLLPASFPYFLLWKTSGGPVWHFSATSMWARWSIGFCSGFLFT